MAKKPLTMRHINDILRLKHEKELSVREIARGCGLPVSTVGDYLKRAESASISWPLPENITQEELLERLLGGGTQDTQKTSKPSPPRPLPDWTKVHEQLRRKGVTLQLLWQEYRRDHPEGYGRSRFCQLYQQWADTVDPVLRQHHAPGDKMFVDWAGHKVPIHNPGDGSIGEASVFIAVLGASNKTFAHAFANEQSAAWIKGHMRAFEFFGGVTRAIVPDNPKTAVIRPCRYEPGLNRNYQEMADHYGTVILPARPLKPRDKAKVEVAVQIVERWILARLRHMTFFSLDELNRAIARLLPLLNERRFKKLPGSRRELYEQLDRPALTALPAQPYVFATWKKARVNIDYHIELERHYYSVPYQLVRTEVEARVSAHTVEIFHRGKRVASHRRSQHWGRHTTIAAHMPRPHREYAEWTPRRLVEWASKTGPATAALVEQILTRRRHPQQGFRSCLGILRLGKSYGEARLEAACRRALHIGAASYKSIESILKHKLDLKPLSEPAQKTLPIDHDNVRGPKYYH